MTHISCKIYFLLLVDPLQLSLKIAILLGEIHSLAGYKIPPPPKIVFFEICCSQNTSDSVWHWAKLSKVWVISQKKKFLAYQSWSKWSKTGGQNQSLVKSQPWHLFRLPKQFSWVKFTIFYHIWAYGDLKFFFDP